MLETADTAKESLQLTGSPLLGRASFQQGFAATWQGPLEISVETQIPEERADQGGLGKRGHGGTVNPPCNRKGKAGKGERPFEIQIVSVYPQNTHDAAGFAQIAPYDPLQKGNPATPPVLYRFRGKQLHADEQLDGGNESPFSKQILSRSDNSGVIPILPVICECDFFQERPSKTSIQPRRIELLG
jgi:hypothetical protein